MRETERAARPPPAAARRRRGAARRARARDTTRARFACALHTHYSDQHKIILSYTRNTSD